MEFDVLIRNGSVYDGTGRPPVVADLGIRDDRVAAVGRMPGASAAIEVDATDKVIAPGFIDAHTHSDMAWLLGPEDVELAAASVMQGVTTEVSGNCGFSPFPFLKSRRRDMEHHLSVLFGPGTLGWGDLASYSAAVRAVGTWANLAPLVGHGSMRVGVIGLADRPPTLEELRTMRRLAEEAFEQGAFGISSGLIYVPGVFAQTEELADLAEVAGRHDRPYVSHIRGETDMVADSVTEAIRIGAASGAAVHISHHKVAGRRNWGRATETLEIIERARRDGADVTVDVYPYTSGSTLLYAMLPRWAQSGGAHEMLERLRDRTVRDRIRADFESGPADWENLQRAAGWDLIAIANCPGRRDIEGRSVAELADLEDKGPADYVFDLLIEQRARVTMILRLMDEADVDSVIEYPASMIGSDGIPLPGKPHPRVAGTFTRILGRYVRERRHLDLAEAIWKMTSLPAERFGIADRGRLTPGAFADVVVFDPRTVADRATFEEPLLQPIGVSDVFVNGVPAVRDGERTLEKAGRVLSAG